MAERPVFDKEIRVPEREYDVIVVGSGPAGSTAAAAIARAGYRPLLLDKVEHPRDKPCGDGVSSSVTKFVKENLGLDLIKADIERCTITGAVLYPPNGKKVSLISERKEGLSFTSPRILFDKVLWEYALSLGSDFEVAQVDGLLLSDEGGRRAVKGKYQANPLEKIEGVVTKDGREITARIVIGADGAYSRVAKSLRSRVADKNELAVAIRAYATVSEPVKPYLHIHFVQAYLPGYGWVFALGKNRVNIGMGIFDFDTFKKSGASLKQHLDNYIAMVNNQLFPIKLESNTTRVWPIPCWTNSESRVVNGVFLVGDAGRFAEKQTGAGIQEAIVTGVLAGRAAIGQLEGEDPGVVRRNFDENVARELERSYRINLFVMNHLIRHERRINVLAVALNRLPEVVKEWVVQIMTGGHTI